MSELDTPRPGPRAFFAIWPDEPASRALGALAQRVALDAQGRATATERLHLTVAFLGTVPAAAVQPLIALGRTIAARAPRFALTLDRVGAFRDAGIAWVGASAPPVALLSLASELKLALGSAGFRIDERNFKVHVTLARRCERRPRLPDPPSISWPVEAMSLMASQLTSHGPRYEELARCPLAPA